MSLKLTALIISVFIIGFVSSSMLHGVDFASGAPVVSGTERISPGNHIKEHQIKVYDDRVELAVSGVEWARFTDTNSMDPFLDKGANALQFVPESPEQIDKGDIISYRKPESSNRVIHRVVYKGEDDQGVYFIVKGDNNAVSDPGKIRFDQIERVLFGIIY
ncbi:MAG: signal peptidase I [Candidatus Woesearchaeota archaeon]